MSRAAVASAPARIDPAQQQRRALLAKVHLGKKQLGLDEGTYRGLLSRVTGKASAGELSPAQLGAVLDEMKAKGFRPTMPARSSERAEPRAAPASRRAQASSPVARKARALWVSLHQLGVVRDPSEGALEAFGARQLKVDRLQWAKAAEAFRLIEALKAMAERSGWSQDVSEAAVAGQLGSAVVARLANEGRDAAAVALKLRLLNRIWRRLVELGVYKDWSREPPLKLLQSVVGIRQFGCLTHNSDEELERCAAWLGGALNRALAAKDDPPSP